MWCKRIARPEPGISEELALRVWAAGAEGRGGFCFILRGIVVSIGHRLAMFYPGFEEWRLCNEKDNLFSSFYVGVDAVLQSDGCG